MPQSQGYWKVFLSKMDVSIKNKNPNQPMNQINPKWIYANMYLFVNDYVAFVNSNVSSWKVISFFSPSLLKLTGTIFNFHWGNIPDNYNEGIPLSYHFATADGLKEMCQSDEWITSSLNG